MKNNEYISPVYWNENHTGAFQKVGRVYNLYDRNGEFFGFAMSLKEASEKIQEDKQ